MNQGACCNSSVISPSRSSSETTITTITTTTVVAPSHNHPNQNQNNNRRNWIPVSLWPRVLERAQKISYFGKVTPTKNDSNSNSNNNNTIQKASAIYLLLRNGPALALRKDFGFSFLKSKKNNIINTHATSKGNNSIIVSELSDNNPKYYTTMKTRQGTKKRKQRSFD